MTEQAPERYRRNAQRFSYDACLICGRSARLVTDHCHRHGWIRGRVCESCNQVMRHEEARRTMAELLASLCSIRHRTRWAHGLCYYRQRRIAHYLRCPDCAERP